MFNRPKAAFYTLGCKLNFAESSSMARLFEQEGYTVVPHTQQADIYVINSCAVTSQAESKGRNIIRKIHRQAPDAFIVVTGCYAQLRAKELAGIDGVNLVLGNDEKYRILERISQFSKATQTNTIQHHFTKLQQFHPAYSTTGRTRSFLKIQDGCDHWCSYCTIPLARGRSRNASVKDISRQAWEIAGEGYKEVILTGVNVADYGKTTGESLTDVMQALENVQGIERYRISSMEPELISDALIDGVARSAKFLPHFHIPLQSGSNSVLKAMRRKYTRELFADRVKQIKAAIPDAFIGVDVITGFPGETRQHFEETYRFLEGLEASFYHVFSYSDRPGTSSEKMKEKVEGNEKKRRSEWLHNLAAEKQLHFYKQQKHTQRKVLFEQQQNNGWMYGFTENYVKTGIPYNKAYINQIVPVYLKDLQPEGFFSAEIQTETIK